MNSLIEQIKLLIELQGLDSHIFKLEEEADSIPGKINEIDTNFKMLAEKIKALEDSQRSMQLKRKEKEVDLNTKEASIKKYQSQLFQIKTNKEYTALQEEIGRIKADNSIIEEEIIRLLDQIDLQSKNIIKEKEILKAEEEKIKVQKKRLDDEAKRLREEAQAIKAQRETLAAKVDKKILAQYERIVRNRGGLAVVAVVNDACQGCHRVLPPQVINEIHMKNRVIVCDSCSRILYIEE